MLNNLLGEHVCCKFKILSKLKSSCKFSCKAFVVREVFSCEIQHANEIFHKLGYHHKEIPKKSNLC